jgi:hypothetical protein
LPPIIATPSQCSTITSLADHNRWLWEFLQGKLSRELHNSLAIIRRKIDAY